MIKDANGNEITYWPITGLIEGQDSIVLDFTVEVPVTPSALAASYNVKVKTWARKVGDTDYVDISVDPYDLSALSGDVDFQGFVEAVGPIEGLERIPIVVSAGTGHPAGWSS